MNICSSNTSIRIGRGAHETKGDQLRPRRRRLDHAFAEATLTRGRLGLRRRAVPLPTGGATNLLRNSIPCGADLCPVALEILRDIRRTVVLMLFYALCVPPPARAPALNVPSGARRGQYEIKSPSVADEAGGKPILRSLVP